MAKMIHCKSCGKEIAKSAKACPHCGAKAKPGCFRIGLATFLIIIGIGLIFGAMADTDQHTKVPTGSTLSGPVETTEAPAPFTVGDTITMDDVYVTLLDVHEFKGKTMKPT